MGNNYKKPTINLKTTNFSDSGLRVSDTQKWSAATLYQYAKDKGYKAFKMPIAGINLDVMPWDIPNILAVCNHIKRVDDTDISIPIILDDTGYIADGWHRLCKAILNGETEILAIRLESMPEIE